jgi:hypothetical protein
MFFSPCLKGLNKNQNSTAMKIRRVKGCLESTEAPLIPGYELIKVSCITIRGVSYIQYGYISDAEWNEMELTNFAEAQSR